MTRHWTPPDDPDDPFAPYLVIGPRQRATIEADAKRRAEAQLSPPLVVDEQLDRMVSETEVAEIAIATGSWAASHLIQSEDGRRYSNEQLDKAIRRRIVAHPGGPNFADCPNCGGSTSTSRVEEPALLRHGGYGATRQSVLSQCDDDCGWQMTTQVNEVRP